MSGECNLQLLHEFKENNNDGIITTTFIATIAGWLGRYNLYNSIIHVNELNSNENNFLPSQS